MQFAAIILA